MPGMRRRRGAVAQLARALALQARGRGFESHQLHNSGRGSDVEDLPARSDADGYRFGLVMLEATSEGTWVDYVHLNPNTGFRELKHSWVVRHDGLIFGSGWYELQRPSIVEFV